MNQQLFNVPKKEEQQEDACKCSLCGSCEPWKCEQCTGIMALPPYNNRLPDGRLFIGSGEDVFCQ